jgi:CheY-like chemotaxis protein
MAINLTKLDKSEGGTQPKKDSPMLSGLSVLVVDDNRIQRKRLKEMYESLGFKCIAEAADGLEALEIVEKCTPDLISLDILMPVMHGVETLGYLKEQGCKSKIVFVSSLGATDAVANLKSKSYQPDAVFSKKDTKEMFKEVLWDIFSAPESEPLEKAI